MTAPDREAAVLGRKWFYRFRLPSGAVTECHLTRGADQIHDTRLEMVDAVLRDAYPDGLGAERCIDIACNEGWFAQHMVDRGFAEVLAVDARAANTDAVRLIKEAYGADRLRVLTSDLHALEPDTHGVFDVVLMLGVLYHLENPIGALRVARALTRRVCLIETQVATEYEASFPWATKHNIRDAIGGFAVVDSAPDIAQNPTEVNLSTIALVPSPKALMWILGQVGFDRVEVVKPPTGAYEQLASGDRLLLACWVDAPATGE